MVTYVKPLVYLDLNNSTIMSAISGKGTTYPKLKIKGNGIVEISDQKITSTLEIVFHGDGGSVNIERARRIGKLRIVVINGAHVHIGELSSFEDCYILADSENVIIGRDCMASFQTSLRTTDAHGIYDRISGDLLNAPLPILIGSHVWIGKGATISKGVELSNNCIVAAHSFVQKFKSEPNTIVGGCRAKKIKGGITWDRRMTPNIYAENANRDSFFEDF